ncbi:hypothetical protein [Hymenobacter metallicola]|uniref:Uncharacterized protein n=1 Tax=Hymenobacter metallicola TaxID=2563114 RepID=A0A4Z0QIV7_9BACT|nr:hypothetical protein [Hymenobacter metallicola]TGE28622.1 hypothetical protein E5K02_03910 [Hymenobacter metallicola]
MSLSCLSLKRLLPLAPLAALAFTSCENKTVPGPESGADYFPLAVGNYRIYQVLDTTWSNYQRTPVSYQFRETVADQITDAAGQASFRVVRAKRVLPTDAWRDDSVMVITATPKYVAQTRNNRRTIDLVFPVRDNYAWNMYSFVSVDTAAESRNEDNRRYEAVGQPFQATAAGKTYRYEQTASTALIVDNRNLYGFDNEYYLSTYKEVYAKGVGPVYRVRRRLNYCDEQSPTCSRSNTRIYKGQARVEVLIEQGKI